MTEITINEQTVNNKLKQASNFKSSGLDKVQNFWLKQLTALHNHCSLSFQRIINREVQMPVWMTEGCTYVPPKSNQTELPNQYRPITCLPTNFKVFTGIIVDAIYNHLNEYSLISSQQSGCIRDWYGAKDQLLLNKTVPENARKNGKNLHMA